MSRKKQRARDLGIPFFGATGPLNAITDVPDVMVGHTTLNYGDGPLKVGFGPVRTGVTVILPRGRSTSDPVFGGWFALNGNGEVTGTSWLEESGFLEGPIAITNTNSVGMVRDAIIKWQMANNLCNPIDSDTCWLLPVVGETYDGYLNDINGHHVDEGDVFAAIESAHGGPVEEGNVGGGTGMICHEFKGGIGTASRLTPEKDGGYVVGVLVQANHGRRENLNIAGIPVGRELMDIPRPRPPDSPAIGAGSIIVVVATNAPILPHQIKRVAKRVSLGIGMMGGRGENSSGDIFIAFSTANPGAFTRTGCSTISMLSNDHMSALFDATVQATREAICNALVAAETMTGVNGRIVYELPEDRLKTILKKYNRLITPEFP